MSQISHLARKQAFWGVDCCAFWRIWFFQPKTKKTWELSLVWFLSNTFNKIVSFMSKYNNFACIYSEACWRTKGDFATSDWRKWHQGWKSPWKWLAHGIHFLLHQTINLCIYIHCKCSIYYICIVSVKFFELA